MGCNGQLNLVHITAELRVMKPGPQNLIPMTDWLTEDFVIRPWVPDTLVLSGGEVRHHLFFATAPGNQLLYVAGRKNGLTELLPTNWSPLAT